MTQTNLSATASPQDHPPSGRSRRSIGVFILVGILLVAAIIGGIGAYWSRQPAVFSVKDLKLPEGETADALKTPGVATVSSIIQVAETLLHKSGGYLTNDLAPPGVLMDNMPNWEYGVLNELRDSVRALRNDFSRSQTQSVENRMLKEADSKFNFDSDSWMLPATEAEYQVGIDELKGYRQALISGADPTARFFTRADNLRAYLMVVEKRLGSYAQRLSASVGDPELTAALAASGAPALEPTPWNQVDDTFFEARGYAWALLHVIQAIAFDFEPVLKGKNAVVSVDQILRDLRGATTRKWSPFVLNGHGYGLLANHSLVMASYLSRANAAVIDLRVLLERG